LGGSGTGAQVKVGEIISVNHLTKFFRSLFSVCRFLLLFMFVLDYVKLQVNGNEKVIFLHRELNLENIF
jgi:hypothetical protein